MPFSDEWRLPSHSSEGREACTVMSARTMTAEGAQELLPGLLPAAVEKAKRMLPPRRGKNFNSDFRLLERGTSFMQTLSKVLNSWMLNWGWHVIHGLQQDSWSPGYTAPTVKVWHARFVSMTFFERRF